MSRAKTTHRYQLRRYRNGTRDPEFGPTYADVAWATEIAHEYAEPDAVIEVRDTETGESLALVGPTSGPEPSRGGDEGSVSGV